MTSFVADISNSSAVGEPETENGQPELEDAISNDSSKSQLSCRTCNQDYNDEKEFYTHLLDHVKLPQVVLQRFDDPGVQKKAQTHKCGPLKFTVKTKNNNFKIINSFKQDSTDRDTPLRVPKLRILLPEQLCNQVKTNGDIKDDLPQTESSNDTVATVEEKESLVNGDSNPNDEKMVELHSLPNESQSPSFPGQSPAQPDVVGNDDQNSFWPETGPSSEDPLHVSESGEKEAETHRNLLQNFLNDTADNTPKDTGINSNETEYISLERLAGPQCPVCKERCLDHSSLAVHQKAMNHYVPAANNSLVPYGQQSLSSLQSNPLDSLSSLPMQQLTQQVSRLQQQQQGQVHQQNVLINIQQFGQPMPHGSPYGRPPDMPPPPPHYAPPPPHYPSQPPHAPPHMYGGYHPQQPPHPHAHHPPPPSHHPMYYPPTSGIYPPMAHGHDRGGQHQYPPPHSGGNMMPPRPPPTQRMAPPPPPVQSPQHRPRARMPMQHMGRGGGSRMPGPRAAAPPAGVRPQQPRPIRRIAPPSESQQPKRKRLDVLIPDTNDNDDCHVISMQKCNDGMPIIKNVQGASSGSSSTPSETDPVVHLTDSITLSVRNPKEAPVVQQKKNDAKAVANILATRGITVTPAAKNLKEVEQKRNVQSSNSPPVAINLNNAVSIIPTARGGSTQSQTAGKDASRPSRPPTVDLTDDDPVQIQASPTKPSQSSSSKRALPHQCDLCPAQYPTMQSLMNHRRSYHKTGPQSDLGVPVIDLRQPAVLNKLASIGVHSYIPLPQLGSGAGSFALPIVSVNAARNPNICNIAALGSGAVLPLGPLRHISNVPNAKQ